MARACPRHLCFFQLRTDNYVFFAGAFFAVGVDIAVPFTLASLKISTSRFAT